MDRYVTITTLISLQQSRLKEFLSEHDIDPSNVIKGASTTSLSERRRENTISIKDGSFFWDRSIGPVLRQINLDVRRGKFIAVVGQMGAGKSSLLSAILGETERRKGWVTVSFHAIIYLCNC